MHMRKLKRGFGLTLAVVVLGLAGTSFANGYGVSAGGFHAYTSADVPYISWNTSGVVSSDTSSYHWVMATGGPTTINTVGNQSFHFQGSGNGGSLTCYTYLTNVTTGAQFSASASTSATGAFNITGTVNVTATGVYYLNDFCYLPPITGGQELSLWGQD
jgi:hypothetical protein